MERTKRILTIAAVTVTAGAIAGFLADGLMPAIACRPIVGQDAFHPGYLACPDTSGAMIAIAILGALGGFWFTYTGRLARLFRKV